MTNSSSTAATETIEQGLEEAQTAFVRESGGEVHEDQELTWLFSDNSLVFANSVIRTRIVASAPDQVIATMLSRLRERRHFLGWWAMPHTSPADLSELLEMRGFQQLYQDTGMALDLSTLPEAVPLSSGLTIERVTTKDTLEDWLHAFGLGFGINEHQLADYSEMSFGVAPSQSVFRRYLARFRGVPAATALLYPAKRAAVIDEVSTIPAMRGQGIATAATLAALRDAQIMGYRTAVLVASEAGAHVYIRLGFMPYGTRRVYVWRPEGS